jgi:hypothetical protein
MDQLLRELAFRSGIGNACKWRKIVGSETFEFFNTKNVGQKGWLYHMNILNYILKKSYTKWFSKINFNNEKEILLKNSILSDLDIVNHVNNQIPRMVLGYG